MSNSQQKLMKFSPSVGDPKPYPSHAKQWRDYNGDRAFLYNPWTGEQRNSRDVGSDPFGLLIDDAA